MFSNTSLIQNFDRRSLKPAQFPTFRVGHPLLKGLIGCWLFSQGAGSNAIWKDLALLQPWIKTDGALSWGPGVNGAALDFSPAGAATSGFTVARKGGTGPATTASPFTVMAQIKMRAQSGSAQQVIINYGEVTDNNFTCTFTANQTTGALAMSAQGGTDTAIAVSTLIPPLGSWCIVGLSQQTAAARTFFLNGRSQVNTTSIAASSGASIGGLSIGEGYLNSGLPATPTGFLGMMSWIYVWNYPLTAAEMQSVYQSPFQLFQQPNAAYLVPRIGAAPAGRTTKNTDAYPLGEWAGMSRRMPNMAQG